MNILFLGGNSQRHQAWVHDMASALNAPFERSIVHDYRHWQTGEPWVDIDYEIEQIAAKTADLAPYVVFAKSIGTMITLRAVYESKLQPAACLLLGLPLNAMTDMDLPADTWLTATQVPLQFVHNQDDPYGSAAELQQLLDDCHVNAQVAVNPGTTHDYLDTVQMAELLKRISQ